MKRLLILVLFLLMGVLVVLTLPLRWLDPPVTAYMLRDRLVNDRELQQRWVDLQSLPAHVGLAVMAAEDQSFPHHHGFDLSEIRQALHTSRASGRLRGASTLSQQLARNLYLWPGGGFVRKGMEAAITVPLELFLPKQRLRELYLNTVEFGPGIYGVEAAARHHFGKSARSLSREEAALLAAVLPAPRSRNASQPDARLRKRQRWILQQMDNLGPGWLPGPDAGH